MGSEVITLPRARDFSRKMNATFEFVKLNYRTLGKSILIISGPPVLVGALISGSFITEFMSLSMMRSADAGNYFLNSSFWAKMGMALLLSVLGFVVNIATINSFIRLYDEKKGGMIEVREVWERVQRLFWSYLGSTFLFYLLLIVCCIVLIMPLVLFATLSGVLTFFAGIAVFCVFLYLIFSSALTLFIQAYEELGFFEALARSFRLVQGKWWSTFGLIMVLGFLVGIASYVFLIPYYAITLPAMMHSVSTKSAETSSSLTLLSSIALGFYSVAQTLLSVLPHIGIAFQYFNLVELKESRGLLNEIETFGQATETKEENAAPEEDF